MHGRELRRLHLVLASLIAVAAAVVYVPASRAADAPANDSWWAPQVLSGASGSAEGTTVGATTQWDEPWKPDGSRATVWYAYTAARNGNVTFTATAAGFTPRVSTCTGQSAQSCYDNGSAVGSLTLSTWQGLEYRISVDTVDGATGPFTLAWSYDGAGPANDYRAEAEELVGDSGGVTGTNVGATVELNEPTHDGSAGENTGHSVWYRWTAPATGEAFFTTEGSSFDTHLRAYTESYDGSLVGQGWYDEDVNPWTTWSRVDLRVVAGATYLLAVDGEAGATGDIRLGWRTVVPQDDDGELPTVQMWSPQPGATVSGTIHFMSDAADNTAVDRVAYTILPSGGGAGPWLVGEAFAPPYDVELDTSVLAPGTYSVSAAAYDLSGNSASNGFTITVGGAPAPRLTVPAAITREATRPGGALVKYSAVAVDYKGAALSVTCSPRSGSLFPLGTTVVTCTTRDAYGGSAKRSFTVTVVDTTAPELTAPEQLVYDATSPDGTTVDLVVGVTDAVSTSLAASCDPASGAMFAIGDVAVACSATDAAGNTGTISFVVHVRGADEQLDVLSALVGSWSVDASLADKLTTQIADVRKHLAAKMVKPACGGLVELADTAAKESGKRLTVEQGDRLLGEGARIRAVVGC